MRAPSCSSLASFTRMQKLLISCRALRIHVLHSTCARISRRASGRSAEGIMAQLRIGALYAIASASLLAGCAAHIYQATDGYLFQDTADPSYEAAVASAAHDLPCDRASILVVQRASFGVSPHEVQVVPIALDGCGYRVTYQVVHSTETGERAARYMLASREAVPVVRRSTSVPAAPPAPFMLH